MQPADVPKNVNQGDWDLTSSTSFHFHGIKMICDNLLGDVSPKGLGDKYCHERSELLEI